MVARDVPRLLYAIRPDAQAEQSVALGSRFDVHFVHALEEAKTRVLHGSFDLVLCGIHFDECQMGPLLEHCRTQPALRNMPFVCIRCIKGVLPERFYARTRSFVEAMGGHYLDYRDMMVRLLPGAAQTQLQEELLAQIDHRRRGGEAGLASAPMQAFASAAEDASAQARVSP